MISKESGFCQAEFSDFERKLSVLVNIGKVWCHIKIVTEFFTRPGIPANHLEFFDQKVIWKYALI
jgi:hypothetical protein